MAVLLAGLFGAASAADAQQPTVAQDTTPSATEHSAASRQPAGEAVVYVYREGMYGAGVHPAVFVNDDFLVELHHSNYARRVVPPGTVVVTASQYYAGAPVVRGWYDSAFQFPSPNGPWASLPGCKGLDVLRLGEVARTDVMRCETDLHEAEAAIGKAFAEGIGKEGFRHPEALEQLCRLKRSRHEERDRKEIVWIDAKELEGCRAEMRAALAIVDRTYVKVRTEFQAQAGTAYYVKWFVATKGRMELVDEATGAKAVRGLKPTKNQ